MTVGTPADGERVFDDLCTRLGYAITKIPENPKLKTPDFMVIANAHTVFAEVKQFDENEEVQRIGEELERDGVHVGPVDFSHDGGLARKLGRQAQQLKDACEGGSATLGVIYSNRLLGSTDYQVGSALRTATIPEEISAVLRVRNERLQGATSEYELFRNPAATIPFPEDLFPKESP
jgi:hypothetical protein